MLSFEEISPIIPERNLKDKAMAVSYKGVLPFSVHDSRFRHILKRNSYFQNLQEKGSAMLHPGEKQFEIVPA